MHLRGAKIQYLGNTGYALDTKSTEAGFEWPIDLPEAKSTTPQVHQRICVPSTFGKPKLSKSIRPKPEKESAVTR
jgi:hypothetical protein